MPELGVRRTRKDAGTSASLSELRIGQVKIPLPNRFPISPERNALKPAGIKEPLPGEVTVLARLGQPDTIKRILTQEEAVKSMAKFLSRETGVDAIRMLYFSFLKGANIPRSEDLKTILDLQYLAGLDLITVQQTMEMSPEDFDSQLKFARRWMEERSVNKPLIPIVLAQDDSRLAAEFVSIVSKHSGGGFGLDLRGGFHYHMLRAVEDYKKKNPEVWVHALQVPPKIRLGRYPLPCSEGMILPMFGVDSFSRWIVPPPPTPLTKDVINVFDPKGWGSLKKREFEEHRKNTTNCKCAVCQGKDLEPFYEGKVLDVLARAKVHDHLSQRAELEKARGYMKEGEYLSLLKSKEYPREFLKQMPKSEEKE